MDTMGERYLRETIIQKAPPRLYTQYWHSIGMAKKKRQTVHRSEKRKGKRQQKMRGLRGSAVFRRKPRLVEKIAEATAMFISGPSPSF